MYIRIAGDGRGGRALRRSWGCTSRRSQGSGLAGSGQAEPFRALTASFCPCPTERIWRNVAARRREEGGECINISDRRRRSGREGSAGTRLMKNRRRKSKQDARSRRRRDPSSGDEERRRSSGDSVAGGAGRRVLPFRVGRSEGRLRRHRRARSQSQAASSGREPPPFPRLGPVRPPPSCRPTEACIDTRPASRKGRETSPHGVSLAGIRRPAVSRRALASPVALEASPLIRRHGYGGRLAGHRMTWHPRPARVGTGESRSSGSFPCADEPPGLQAVTPPVLCRNPSSIHAFHHLLLKEVTISCRCLLLRWTGCMRAANIAQYKRMFALIVDHSHLYCRHHLHMSRRQHHHPGVSARNGLVRPKH